MEVVQQSHLHLGADGERAILETIARDAKRRPHVIEYAIGRCEALNRLKGHTLRGAEHAQIHLLDRLSPPVSNVASGRLPDGILRIKLDAFIDTIRIFLMQMHVDQVERILALFLIGLWQVAASKKLLDRLSGFLDDIHECSPVQLVQELRQKNGNARCPRNEARAKLLWRVDTRKGREMSLLGTWQTFGPHPQMSAFGGKADMGITLRNVR